MVNIKVTRAGGLDQFHYIIFIIGIYKAKEPVVLELDKADIDKALPIIQNGLEKYWRIQKELMETDVAEDRGFQTRFNAFYKVRRDKDWRSVFYDLLQREKTCRRPFADVLRSLFSNTGKFEASFASKLVASVNPEKPVIDSIVLKICKLKLPSPTAPAEIRLQKIDELYRELSRIQTEFLDTDNGRYLTDRFAELYPGRPVTRRKMLDLVLWKTRKDAEPGSVADPRAR
jgi:hypothetical protein